MQMNPRVLGFMIIRIATSLSSVVAGTAEINIPDDDFLWQRERSEDDELSSITY